MKDYTIVAERSISLLIKRIKPMLIAGWIPTGGVSVIHGIGYEEYVQALILPFNAEGFKQPR